MSKYRQPHGEKPGDIAVVSMMRRVPRLAFYDGVFWRSCDNQGPVKCVPAAVTHLEPYAASPASPAPATESGQA